MLPHSALQGKRHSTNLWHPWPQQGNVMLRLNIFLCFNLLIYELEAAVTPRFLHCEPTVQHRCAVLQHIHIGANKQTYEHLMAKDEPVAFSHQNFSLLTSHLILSLRVPQKKTKPKTKGLSIYKENITFYKDTKCVVHSPPTVIQVCFGDDCHMLCSFLHTRTPNIFHSLFQ